MTIYTTDQSLNPEKKELVEHAVDVEIQISEKKALTGDAPPDYDECGVYNDTVMPVIRQRQPKRRVWLQLILFVGMLLGLTMCVLGSVYLYRGMYHVRYTGRCGVGIIDVARFNDSEMAKTAALTGAETTTSLPYFVIDEEVDIDDLIETLMVPSQGKAKGATFRNDFSRNVTAIKDDDLGVCYMLPFLNAFTDGSIPQPADFSNFLLTAADEVTPMYNQMDEYFSSMSEVDNILEEFGDAIAQLCEQQKAFKAEPVDLTTVAPTTTTAKPYYDNTYWMFPGGESLFNYHIIIWE